MKRVVVQIDRLVLRGFDSRSREQVAEGLRAGLGEVLSGRDGLRQLSGTNGKSRLKVGAVSIGQGSTPEAVGRQLARGMFGGGKK